MQHVDARYLKAPDKKIDLLGNIFVAKITLCMAVSLDGFMAREDGSVDWWPQFVVEDIPPEYSDLQASVDTLLLGRKAYEGCLLDSREFENMEFDDYLSKNNCKAYVFTNSVNNEEHKNVEFVSDVAGFIRHLKGEKVPHWEERKGLKNIFLGGGGEVNTLLLCAGLIDEVLLIVAPILLGRGKPLFNNAIKDVIGEPLKVKQYGNLVISRYRLNNV